MLGTAVFSGMLGVAFVRAVLDARVLRRPSAAVAPVLGWSSGSGAPRPNLSFARGPTQPGNTGPNVVRVERALEPFVVVGHQSAASDGHPQRLIGAGGGSTRRRRRRREARRRVSGRWRPAWPGSCSGRLCSTMAELISGRARTQATLTAEARLIPASQRGRAQGFDGLELGGLPVAIAVQLASRRPG